MRQVLLTSARSAWLLHDPPVVGFSGGGDSMALLLELSALWGPVVTAIVDHGLREGSAKDAARAAAIAREIGVDAEIIKLDWPHGPKPAQQAARRGRMTALAAFARRAGARAIALAHTRNDQAETVLLRLAAGSSMVGLAGMAASSPAPLWPEGRGLKLVRPLLRRSREDLRDQLREARLEWIEDPSNLKTEYARVRARQTLASWEQSGLGVERWAGLADLLAWHVGGLDGAARTLIEQGVRFEGPAALVDIGALASTPRDVQHRALGAVIAAAGAAERAPDEAALDRVLAALGQGRTIGGAQLKRKNDSLEVGRDPGGVTGRGRSPALAALDLPPGEEVVWDGRLALLAHEPGWRAEPAEGGQRPLLRHGNRLETLEDASKTGAVIANWLLRERIAHLLWR